MAGNEFPDFGIWKHMVQVDGIGVVDYVKQVRACFTITESLLELAWKDQILVDVPAPFFK